MSEKVDIIKKCRDAAFEMRKDALKMTLCTGNTGAHVGGGLSMIEVMATLYMGIMKYDIQNPLMEERDRFILSKGHGVLALYTALNQAGFVSKEDLWNFKSNDTQLYGHPSLNQDIGIEFSSGSLGQGLSLGVGVCLAMKMKKNTESRSFVLLGDGECNEGSVWEAAASASHYKLNNLVAIVDKNQIQYDGLTDNVLSMSPLDEKWKSFGWRVVVVDGHNIEELHDALSLRDEKPLAIIANTVKGKGISFIENDPKWHNSRLTQTQYDAAISELESIEQECVVRESVQMEAAQC